MGGSPSSGVVDGYYYDEGASSAGPNTGPNVSAYHDLDVTLDGGHADDGHGLGQDGQYLGGGAGGHGGGGGGHGLGQGNQYLGGGAHDHGGHGLGQHSQYGGHADGGQYLDGGVSSDGMLHPPEDDGAAFPAATLLLAWTAGLQGFGLCWWAGCATGEDSFDFFTMKERVETGLSERHDKGWLMDHNIIRGACCATRSARG